MARLLVLSYSQTGQLTRVARSMLAPLAAVEGVTIDWREVLPRTAYPFPWRFLPFLDAFPESVLLDPPPVDTPGLDPDVAYDLVILAYQVWFLAPSLPITGFLRSPQARVLNGRRVITLVACRNMWLTAHQLMGELLRGAGATLVDNVVLTDQGPLWSTFLTTPWWLLTGNKGPLFGVFPQAGVSQLEIDRAARFGRALVDALPLIAAGQPGPFLHGLEAVHVNRRLMLSERIGRRSFSVWGRLVRAFGRPGSVARKPVLLVYALFLVALIGTVLPISMTIAALMARFSDRVRQAALILEAPSGSSGARLSAYDSPRNCDSL